MLVYPGYLPRERSRTGRKKNHGKKNTEKVTLVEPRLKKHSFVLPRNLVTVL